MLPAKDKKNANGSKSAASAASKGHKFEAVIKSAASAASPMMKWVSHEHLWAIPQAEQAVMHKTLVKIGV